MESIDHLLEVIIGSESCIYKAVISCVISVCVRFEHRREIYCITAELLYMRDPVKYFEDPVSGYAVILERSTAKSERIYLIKDCFFKPHLCFSFFLLFHSDPDTGYRTANAHGKDDHYDHDTHILLYLLCENRQITLIPVGESPL